MAWRAARRWRTRAQLLVATAGTLGVLFLDDRTFRLVGSPIVALGMVGLCVAGLAQSVRRARDGVVGPERLPILGAMVTYWVVSAIARPLIETLYRSDLQAMIDAHMGAQLVYAGCMTVVAWGVSRRAARPDTAPAAGPERTAAPRHEADAPPVVAPPDAYPEPKRPAARQAI